MKTWQIVGLIVGVAVIAFGYYTISPLFITITMDEADPSAGGARGSFASVIGTDGHPASGAVRIIEADGKKYIRYENFKTINGPDIYVYLANDLDATEFVNLGRVKATEGNVNYEIPAGVNAAEYRYAMVWCRAFGVLFNYADISAL
ncbi:MAG: DM13 domain-containing protein [Candidatus Liptonbacteria bacterium]|nr:DM13 domain-containing protein [Candidatus Niyogibacteria bacterium]MBI4087403.1 DM13 domain-containing protein [Candidatus Liptonbacteria bacterium]